MKKSILTLLVLIVCAIQTTTAYEYFTIYFSDGTKSEAFYATDVDSICYSKLSLDSIAYDDWQVQEIYTCDSVYRYPLAQIDSLSFKDVDVNIVAEDVNRANSVIVPLYVQYESAAELSQHLSTIRNVDGVEDAWIDGQSLFIDIRDYGTISFIYPPALMPLDMQYEKSISFARRSTPVLSNEHNHIDVKGVCVYNQTVKDENPFFDAADEAYQIIYGMNQIMGIACSPFTNLSPEFFQKDIFNYDIVFLMTHGEYDSKHNLHWIYTSEELLCAEKEDLQSSMIAATRLLLKYPFYSPYLIGCAAHKEIRNGKQCIVYYTKISERFISSSPNRFRNDGSAMVFNAACESLKGNDNMAKAFINKGAACYLGYNETNNIGHGGAKEFCAGLLNGSSVQGSFNCIPLKWREQMYETQNACYPVELRCIKSNNNISNICVVEIETIDSDSESSERILRGKIRMLNTSIVDNYTFGFQYSTNSDMSQAKNKEVQGNYDSSTLYMNWEATLDESDLQPNTTYYYRAYMNDGYSNCYGEIKQFTTKGDNGSGTGEEDTSDYKLYWVDSDKVRTYYYDNKYFSRMGYVTSDIHCSSSSLVKVILDNSLKKYKGLKEIYFNCRDLESIVGLDNLNTENIERVSFSLCESLKTIHFGNFDTSNMTSMAGMFSYCSSLTSLDLSGFNTSNVTDMASMFECCISLTSLDLSSFNTSNVTNMARMFSYCSSLTSLDLSSFNTSNVTNMAVMFFMCNSMTNFNLSSFDTKNVEDMYGMFEECNLLSSLDLSNFNTKNVKDIDRMFAYCSSLTILDLSSFNIVDGTNVGGIFWECSSLKTIYAGNWSSKKITSDRSPFCGCNNLVGGKGTKIGKNIYGYYNENPLYYYCGDDGEAMHIDGGKDWPGLFTAK